MNKDPEKWDLKANIVFYLILAAIIIGIGAFLNRNDGPDLRTQGQIDSFWTSETQMAGEQRDYTEDYAP